MLNKETRLSKLEKWIMGVTFAEAGEHDTALEMMGKGPVKRRQRRIRRRQDNREDRRPVLMA